MPVARLVCLGLLGSMVNTFLYVNARKSGASALGNVFAGTVAMIKFGDVVLSEMQQLTTQKLTVTSSSLHHVLPRPASLGLLIDRWKLNSELLRECVLRIDPILCVALVFQVNTASCVFDDHSDRHEVLFTGQLEEVQV